MAKRVTEAEIILFHKLFDEYHNYAEVARRTGRSASTISRYIGLKNKPNIMRHTTHRAIVK